MLNSKLRFICQFGLFLTLCSVLVGCAIPRCGDPGVYCPKWQMDMLVSQNILQKNADGTYQRTNEITKKGIMSAAGESPGYYAGLQQDVKAVELTRWQEWYDSNRPAITDILTKIKEIKVGQIKPGCIGRDIHTCIATLSQTLAMADYFPVTNLYAPDKVDVNGNVLFEHNIFITGFIPGVREQFSTRGITFLIELGYDRTVKTVKASLPNDPFFARTQEEYDRTSVYEVISAMVHSECPNLSRNEVARFIENKVKPAAELLGKETSYSSGDIVTGNNKQAKDVKFCGQRIDFDSFYGNSTDLASHNDPHGSFGGMNITFK